MPRALLVRNRASLRNPVSDPQTFSECAQVHPGFQPDALIRCYLNTTSPKAEVLLKLLSVPNHTAWASRAAPLSSSSLPTSKPIVRPATGVTPRLLQGIA